MNRYEAIMEKTLEEFAELIADHTMTGACNDFGIKSRGKCDGDCYCCIKEHLEREDDEE